MSPNRSLFRPGSKGMKANDLFPMNGTDLIKDFLLLESCDLMNLAGQDRSHQFGQMTKLLALLEPNRLCGRWIVGCQECQVYVRMLNSLVVVADSMPGELGQIQSLLFFVGVLIKLIFLSMISLVYFTGVLGNIMSGLVYLSPTPTFWRILKRRSTEEFESLPYICKLLNAYFWVYYGLIKPDSLLVATVNMFGAVVEIIFLYIFLLYAPPGMKARTAILVAILDVGFPAAAVLLTQFLLHGDVRIDVAGLLCVGFSMIAYASPLSAMKTVVTTKSVEYMPFLLSFILFVNGGVWAFYAFLTKDWFVGTPNGTGFLLGTAQLILYAIYWKPKSSKQQVLNNEDLEDHNDRQREPLIIPAAGSQSVNAEAET